MNKDFGYLIWAWGTTVLMGGVILAIALTGNLASASASEEVLKVSFRMLLYFFLFLLLYRSIIASLRNTVERLADWKSKREAHEDAEFVLIIETFVVITTILATTVFAGFEEYIQNFVDGREADFKDVLVSIMAILLSALVVYSIPSLGEIEFAIQNKLEKEFGTKKSKKSE